MQPTSCVLQGVGCPADPTPTRPHDQGSYCFRHCRGSEMCCRHVSWTQGHSHLRCPASKATRYGPSSTSHRPLSSERPRPPTPGSGVGGWVVLVVVVLVVMHGCSFSGTIPARLSLTVHSDSLCLGDDTDTSPSVATHEPVCRHQFVSDRDSCASVFLDHQPTHQDHHLPSHKS